MSDIPIHCVTASEGSRNHKARLGVEGAISMSHYQKHAIVLFRVIGLALVVSMSVVLPLHIILYRADGTNSVELLSAILYLLLGIFLTVLSTPLSRLAVKSIKDE
jgi:hypothetical protein